MLAPPPRAARGAVEQLDLSGHDEALLAGSLRDLRRVNRWLGGTRLTLRALDSLTSHLARGSDLRVLDVGTGSADVPDAVAAWARRRGLRARVVATDSSPEILALASVVSPEVELAVADARSLPFEEESFDVAACSLLLHHLGREDAVAALREMRRVARLGIVVNDLVRTWVGYAGAWALSRFLTRNALTRHDAPLSVRRAYTVGEMRELAESAGLGDVRFERALGYRVAMVAGGAR